MLNAFDVMAGSFASISLGEDGIPKDYGIFDGHDGVPKPSSESGYSTPRSSDGDLQHHSPGDYGASPSSSVF